MLKFGTEVSMNDSERSKLMRIQQNFPSEACKNIRNVCLAATPASVRGLKPLEGNVRPEAIISTAPDVRAEKVARGRALVADPNYPSREQIKKIAHLLATQWKPVGSAAAAVAVSVEE